MISQAMKAIFRKELKSYFTTPVGYVFLIIFLVALGKFTFEPGRGSFFLMRQASLDSFFNLIPMLFIFLVPAASMRLWAEERKSGTIELLLTMPVTVKDAVLGKFFAAWVFINFALFCTFPMVFTVIYLGNPDPGVIFLGYLGSSLLAASFLAVGTFFSALTKNQVISFILSIVVCYLLLMAGSPPILNFLSLFGSNYLVHLFESMSIIDHFDSLGKGVIRLSDLWFFGVMIVSWLYASVILLSAKKAS